eukprot:3763598-Amphidinium_carterae.1
MVLAAVSQDGMALQWAGVPLNFGNRPTVLRAVEQNGLALQWAVEELKSDHEVVLRAVEQNGLALQWAAEELKSDHEVVLRAVQQNGLALQWAAEELKADRHVALSAVTSVQSEGSYSRYCIFVLEWVGDDLLSDISFVSEVKKNPRVCGRTQVSFVKITWCLSGRSTVVLCDEFNGIGDAQYVIKTCCKKFGCSYTGNEVLFHESGEVPLGPQSFVSTWPGFQPGAISEYSFIRSV